MKIPKYVGAVAAATVMLVTGCASVQPEREHPVPELFIQFDAGDDVFNNRYHLTERLSSAVGGYEKRPVVVMVAAGNSQDDYDLAVSRLFSVANTIRVDADFHVLVKPIEREEQRNKVAVYHAPAWNDFHRRYMADGDYSWVKGSGGVFRSSDKRLFLANPSQRIFTPDGSNGVEHLSSVLSALGWGLFVTGSEEIVSRKALNEIRLVTLEQQASVSEINYLLKSVMHNLLPGCDYAVEPAEKRVSVWKRLDRNKI